MSAPAQTGVSARALPAASSSTARKERKKRTLSRASSFSAGRLTLSARAAAFFMGVFLGSNSGETVNPRPRSVADGSRPRVGAFVDLKQPRRIDPGIDLRGRQAGMAEQFLDGPEVAATPKE